MSDPPAVADFLGQSPDSLQLSGSPGEPGSYPRVLVSVADRAALRSCVIAPGVKSPAVGIYVAADSSALSLRPKPEWPPLVAVRSNRTAGGEGWMTVLRFTRQVPVAEVVAELGRQCVWPDRAGNRGLWLVGSEKVEPDRVVLDGTAFDERIFNPVGFEAGATGPVVELDPRVAPSSELVRSLRQTRGVRVDGSEPALPALAMAGVPLVPTTASGSLEALDPGVRRALTAEVDLADPVAREEHSIVLRRAALRACSTAAWRRRAAAAAGVRVAAEPSVSIVLATRRPEMLEHALEQVGRQRGVGSLELVLAPHGFDVDPARARELLGPSVSVQVVGQPDDVLFGGVLARAADAADGDVVLKMDDDDWYSPDFVADLLLAREYSGAELVGCAPELHYLAAKDVTVKRGHPAELYARFVAGGTMMIDRGLLRAVGSFRSVPRWVDAQLLAAVLGAGAAIYRTHGLGYLLRRNPTGHTWTADLDYLLDPARVESIRPGFAPGRLFE